MSSVDVLLRILPHGRGLNVPTYMTEGAAAADVEAAVQEPLIVGPRETALVPLGFEMALPRDFEAQLRPRSGLALENKVTILNSPATIDSDYRGEISVLVVNHGSQPFTIERGRRIAQLVVAPVARCSFQVVADLPSSRRAKGGFGSTGNDGT